MNKRTLKRERGAVMMEYVILVMMLAVILFAGNNYLTNDDWLDDKLFEPTARLEETLLGAQSVSGVTPTFGKDVAGMYQRVMAGLCLPTP